MNPFEQKVAVVTGGASGIGKELCLELARRRAVVMVADINLEGAQRVSEQIQLEGGKSVACRVDTADRESVHTMIQNASGQFGQIDFLFNNAGISVTGDFRDLKPEDWKKVMDVNLWGVIHGCAEVVPFMAARGSGHIVNTGSLSGLLPFPTNLPYTTSKHAVVGFSLGLRAEATDLGVDVSVVCPGFVRTGMFAATPAVNVPHEKLYRQMPVDSFLDPRKAAQAILAGVAKKQAIIIFPASVQLLWWLYRLWPGSMWWNQLRITRQFRKLRGNP